MAEIQAAYFKFGLGFTCDAGNFQVHLM